MRNRVVALITLLLLCCGLFAACGSKNNSAALPDGVYTVDVATDSSMFHINETCGGKGALTVENGEMTLPITLASKNIVSLFPGTSEDAKKEGAALLQPTLDSVTYSDGTTDEVYGFDIPVSAPEGEFPCAIIGTHGNWYDHMVTISDPEPAE